MGRWPELERAAGDVSGSFGTLAGSVLTAVYLTAMMFSVGIGLRVGRHPEEAPRGQLGLHLRGLVLDVALIPAVAVGLTRSLHLSSHVGFALLVVAACPGGRFAPHLARIAEGDVAFATSRVLLMTKVGVLTAPLTLKWLLGLHQLHVDWLPMVAQGFLLQMLPLYAGKAVARRRADVADRIERPLRRIVAATTVAVLVVFVWRSGLASVALLGDRGWLAVGGVTVASVALGWLLGGRRSAPRRSLVVGGMSRNLALALLLAGLAFPGRHHVQLAVFGVWWILIGASYAFAWIAANASGRPARHSPLSAS